MEREVTRTMAATQKFSNSPLIVYTKLSPNHSGKRTQNIDTIAIHCLPVDNTDLLTKNGWKSLRNIKKGDIVAASNQFLNIKFEPVQEIVPIRKEDVYSFSTGFMGTSKHRMLFKTQYEIESGKPFRVGTVDDILKYNSTIFIPNSGLYCGKDIDLDFESINFICATQADGSYQWNDKHDRIYYIRFRVWKDRKVSSLKHTLDNLGFVYTSKEIYGTENYDHGVEFVIKDKIAIELCQKYLDDKMFKYSLLDMSIEQTKHFARCLTLWDGTYIESDNYTEMRYVSHKKQNIDVVSAVLGIHGIGTRLDGGHTLTFKMKEYRSIGKVNPEVLKDVEVSCVTVPSGFIVIRQNGRVHLVGNCMAGNCTIETCGQIFAPSSRQASSNYGVGSDGRRGMYVEEKNRSWCTSTYVVDQRAITIEVANCGGAPDWPITDKALASLIELCTDICKRNNIKKLLWLGDKGKMGQVNLQNMVVHRWTAAKACPGNALYNKHSYIAAEVNKRLGGTTVPTPPPVITPPTNPVAGSAEKTIWNFLKAKGLNSYAVAGVMGNLYAESGLYANNLQNSYEKKLGYTDETYTAAVDSGKYANFVRDSAGYGLAQWTFWSRKEGLLNYAKKVRKSIGDLNTQLEFLWSEMQTFKNMMNILKSATSVRQASDVVLLDFERPADKGEGIKAKRAEYGMSYYKKNADSDTSNLPYLVKVNDATVLNIRKGPGTNNAIAGSIKDNGVYTITQESTGVGAKKWGKLKSGTGWISLDFCIKVS